MAVKSKKVKGKHTNKVRSKLLKQSKVTGGKKTKKVPQKAPKLPDKQIVQDEEESDHGEDMLQMVDPEDLDFLKNAIANQSYSILNKVRYTEASTKGKKKKHVVDDEALENDYENQTVAPVNVRNLLPVKTKQGIVKMTMEVDNEETEEEEIEDAVEEENYGSEEESEDGEYAFEESGLDLSKPITTAQMLKARNEALLKKKLHIGTLSSGLLENPEEKVTNFRTLLKLLDDETPEVYVSIRKLAVVSLLEVFKDLLPGYQIKLQDISGVKLKKDTLKLHKYEESLLQYYKKYLQKLEKFSSVLFKRRGDTRVHTDGEKNLGEVALHSMCDILVAHPYFNFSQNVAQAVVPFLNNRDKNVRDLVSAACRTIFKEDKKEEITLKIMRIINQYLKSHAHNVNPDMLEIFLSLRIKEVNLDQEKEQELKQKKLQSHKQNVLSLSKKERKRKKRLQELEKEMLETKAEESKQTKQQNLTDITKILFGIYFRILKSSTNTKVLGVCLEGLAKFAHCINLEYYVDIVAVLDKLLKEDWMGYKEKLNCIRTVFSILTGQGETVHMDPTRFYVSLYKDLLSTTAGKDHANFAILLHTVIDAIIKRRKKITNKRIVGFVKRLTTLSLQLLHNSTLGCLSVVKTVMQLNKATDILLDLDNSVGDGQYNAELNDPEYCNASSTALFELALLNRHYHPIVRKYAKHIAAGVPATGEGSLDPQYGKCLPEQLYADFDMSEMAFNPAIPIPKKAQPKAKVGRHNFIDEEFRKFCYVRSRIDATSNGKSFFINL